MRKFSTKSSACTHMGVAQSYPCHPLGNGSPVKVYVGVCRYDLRQKCEGKGKFGKGKRHKRGGMRQKSV